MNNAVKHADESISPVNAEHLEPAPIPKGASPKERKYYACMAVLKQATVPDRLAKTRAHEALATLFPTDFATASSAKNACRRGMIMVDDQKAVTSTPLEAGQVVRVLTRIVAAKLVMHGAVPERLAVAYEDSYLAVVIKPQGMPTLGRALGVTAAHCIKHCVDMPSVPGILHRAHVVHRLDADTGGLLVCAKTRPALAALSDAFASRAVKKRYRAIVKGRLEGCGRITFALDGKPSWTEYRVAEHSGSSTLGGITTLDLWPHTGRTHQLRKHLAYIGHPILGDVKYWREPAKLAPGQTSDEHVKLADSELIDAPQTAQRSELPEPAANPLKRAAEPLVDSQPARRSPCHAAPDAAALAPPSALRDFCADVGEDDDVVVGAADAESDLEDAAAAAEATPAVPAGSDSTARSKPCKRGASGAHVMCLWAVQCKLKHPITGDALDVCIPEPQVYTDVRAQHAKASS